MSKVRPATLFSINIALDRARTPTHPEVFNLPYKNIECEQG